jgi:hypothetical protein
VRLEDGHRTAAYPGNLRIRPLLIDSSINTPRNRDVCISQEIGI